MGFFYENQLNSLVAMVTWNFHTLIIGRIEKKSHLVPSHCRYFNKTFIEMLLRKCSSGSLLSAVCVFAHYFGVKFLT